MQALKVKEFLKDLLNHVSGIEVRGKIFPESRKRIHTKSQKSDCRLTFGEIYGILKPRSKCYAVFLERSAFYEYLAQNQSEAHYTR